MAALASCPLPSTITGADRERDRFRAASRPGEFTSLASEVLLTALRSCRLDITSEGGIGPGSSEDRWGDVTRVEGADVVTEVGIGSVMNVGGLGERLSTFTSFWILTAASETSSLSPTLDEKRGVGASSIAGPTTTVEHSSECSRHPAEGTRPRDSGFRQDSHMSLSISVSAIAHRSTCTDNIH